MSESVADNLKTELLKSGRFLVMDVALLRKIDPNMQFVNLTDVEVSALAQRLNCEGAVIGRYFISRKDGKDKALIQTEGVDTLTKKSVVIKSQYAELDGAIFTTVQELAVLISQEMNEKLPPLSSKMARRDAKLEKLIARLENPPKGFLDAVNLTQMRVSPEFDIDTFVYDAEFSSSKAEQTKEFEYELLTWGRTTKPVVETDGIACKGLKCTVQKSESQLIITKDKQKDIKYVIRLHADKDLFPAEREAPKPFVGRWWLTAGYPYMKSIAVANQATPQYMAIDGPLPLSSLSGFGFLETGISPARRQFPAGIKWAFALQFAYANGSFSEYSASYPTKAQINMLSGGGGLRFDRPFYFGKVYSLAPAIGLYIHYQRYFRSLGTGYNLMAVVPEIGLNQYFRFGAVSNWNLVISVMAGSFIFANENLSYVRGSLGVEYALR